MKRHRLPADALTVGLLIFAASPAASALPAKHSKEFGLRFECDVAPAVAGWSLTPGSTAPAPLASNGWIRFTTALVDSMGFENSLWRLSAGQDYTMEILYRTPQRGQLRFTVADGNAGRETLAISSTGLFWSVNEVPQLISSNRPNAQHSVRFAAWLDGGQRRVQVWQDGRSIYAPPFGSVPAPPGGTAVTSFGEMSPAEECDIEIDHVRMEIGAAFAPFSSDLAISAGAESVGLTWSTVPKVAYQVQWSANLSDWFDFGQAIPALSSSMAATDATAGRPTRFYRVRESGGGAFDQPWLPGSPPVCTNLPALNCTAGCADLVFFEPVAGPGYENYPINGETAQDQYRSYIRRDVRQAIMHAAARVECMAGHWPFGNNRPVGLGDMSEVNGSIPGTRDGAPAHPAGTHTNGNDIDVAYYQLDTPDNRIRPICDSRTGGAEQYRCTAAPATLDAWRTAFFVGILTEHPKLRVIGVDGKAGPLLTSTVQQLAGAGWLSANAPTLIQQKLAFETSDQGLGWYYFHHNHMHISFRP
jgi:hypothetical protein